MLYQLLSNHRCYFSKLALCLFIITLPLSVLAEITQPEITNIKARSEPSQIKIDFDKPLSPWSAIATGNYYISDGVRVLDARLSINRKSVLLDTTPLNENSTYKLLTFNIFGDSDSDTPPPLFSVQSTDDPTMLNVIFNQPVSPSTAQNIDNYSITKDIDIVSATLSADYLTVALQVSPALEPDNTHTLVVTNVSRLKAEPVTTPTAPTTTKPDNNKNNIDPDNPLPAITLEADSALIEYNSMARLSWQVENATSCVGSGAWSGYKPTSGTRNIGPLKGNSVFFLTCRGPNGSSTKFITVSVLAAQQPVLEFSANKMAIPKNTRPVISWSVENATDCTASGDWSGEKPPQGSEQLGLLTDDVTLFLTCRGAGGSTMQSLNITIANPPTIMLKTSRSTVGYLGIPTLNWYVTDAESCIGSGTDTGESPPTCGGLGIDSSHNKNNYYNTSEWYKSPLATQGTLSVGPLCVDTTFFLTCTGPGGTSTDFVEVKVLESQPDIRLNANRAYAKPGEKITLTWETLRVNSCTASGGWSGTKSAYATNSEIVGPITEETVYTLTCKDQRGRSAERSVKVRVKTETPSPVTDIDITPPPPNKNISSLPTPRSVTTEQKPVPVREHTFTTEPISSNTDIENTPSQEQFASEWQIASDRTFTDLIFQRIITGEDKLVVPTGLLNRNTDYWIRTRQQDSAGQWSAWSAVEPFSTQKYDANDLDSNDIDDQFQMVGFIDTNNNDKDDKQEGICNIYDAFKKTVVGIQASQGVLRCLSALSEDELEAAIKSDGQIDSMPYGLFNFKIEQLPTNSSATEVDVIFYFEKPLPAESQWYQYDKTTDTLERYTGSAEIDGNKVTIRVADGGPGDLDGIKNGIIISPIGPMITTNKALIKPVLMETATTIGNKYGIGSSGVGFVILLLLTFLRRRITL
ncbi:MAG TPA: hypothetical protein ENJ07_01395 [Gammaproteobacteria bacterium]|nr:hypothetical protein [Gammaproteobacteria bacterium]